MIVFTIIRKDARHRIPHSIEAGRRAESEVYDSLQTFVDEETAIEASSWCDLATIGEEFHSEKFDIICEEL